MSDMRIASGAFLPYSAVKAAQEQPAQTEPEQEQTAAPLPPPKVDA